MKRILQGASASMLMLSIPSLSMANTNGAYFENLEYQTMTIMEKAERNGLLPCDKATDSTWKIANELLGLVPGLKLFSKHIGDGISDLIKLGTSASKITNITTCNKNGEHVYTLTDMTNVANMTFDDRRTEELAAQGSVFLDNFSEHLKTFSKYDQLNENERTNLSSNLYTDAFAASTIEAGAQSLHFNTMHALAIISSNKLAAFSLRHQLTDSRSSLREQFAEQVRNEAKKSQDLHMKKVNEMNDHISGFHFEFEIEYSTDILKAEFINTLNGIIKDGDEKIISTSTVVCRFSLSENPKPISNDPGCNYNNSKNEYELEWNGRQQLKVIQNNIRSKLYTSEYAEIMSKIYDYTTYFNYYKIENSTLPGHFIHVQNDLVTSGNISNSWWSADWIFEKAYGVNIYRIRNRWKLDQYLNIENGKLQSSPIESGWHSGQWTVKRAPGGLIQFQNLWKPDQYLHMQYGQVMSGRIENTWHSAQWIVDGL